MPTSEAAIDRNKPARLDPLAPAPPRAAQEADSVSIWLYLAGLCVTLSGLYAVNFGIADQGFTTMTYVLAFAGYVTSYLLRSRGIPLRALQVPLAVVVVLFAFSTLQGDSQNWFLPSGIGDDRAKGLQILFVWMAILHTFTLATDAAILFACVPCMTMIALVSTTSSEAEVQNAFLLFICSATFLLVHENYLRTRAATLLGRSAMTDRRLFGGQIQLAAVCFVGALLLAQFVAVPIRSFGQKLVLAPAGNASGQNSRAVSPLTGSTPTLTEKSAMELATGPQTESDTPLLRVKCGRGLYWRGTSYDFYTGRSFESHFNEMQKVNPTGATSDLERSYTNFGGGEGSGDEGHHFRYLLPSSPVELPAPAMEGSALCRQDFTILGGVSSQIYGAGDIKELRAPFMGLDASPTRNLVASERLPIGAAYTVFSQVANDDPAALRAASATDIPADIATVYLQTSAEFGGENPRLRALAQDITHGQTNNYDRAMAIQQYIASHCKYNLQASAAPPDRDRVEYFLFDLQQGYCDSFGAAMTMLCRYAGIPARLASGFLSGDLDEGGNYVVREKHKHIWAEVFFPHVGWVPFDATEGAEDISDHRTKSARRTSFLTWFLSQGALPPLVGLLMLGSLGYLFKTEVYDRWSAHQAIPRSCACI